MVGEAQTQPPHPEKMKFRGVVRALQKDDLASVTLILETWLRSMETGLIVKDEIEDTLVSMRDSLGGKNKRTYFVAEEGGQIIGVIGMSPLSNALSKFVTTLNPVELVNAYVASEHRVGRGVGRALVAKVEEEARHRGYSEIILDSGPRNEHTAWGFYDRLEGFSRIGVAVGRYGEGYDAPVWHKLLI